MLILSATARMKNNANSALVDGMLDKA